MAENLDTPTVLLGIRRNRSDTGIGTMTSTPHEIQRIERECAALDREIRNTTAALRNNSYNDNHQSNRDFMKPLVRPSAYDGSEPWGDYKVQFELVAEMNGWDDIRKPMFLASSLRGAAQGVLADLEPGKRRSYVELSTALSRRFGSENRTELFRVQLKNLVRKRDRSLPELAQYIKRLSRKAYPNAPRDLLETLCLGHFIDALTDSDMRLRIQQAHPKTIDDAKKLSVELDAFNMAEKQPAKRATTTVRNVTVSDYANEKSFSADDIKACMGAISKELVEMRKEIATMKKSKDTCAANSKPSTKEIRCWNCGGNHFRRNCPKAKKLIKFWVVLEDTSVVPTGSEMLLQGKVLDTDLVPKTGLVIPTEKFTEKYKLIVGKAVVNLSKEKVPIRVLNVSGKSIKLYPRTVVGHCEAVTIDRSEETCSYPDGKIPDYLSTLLSESCVNLDGKQSEILKQFLINNKDVFAPDKLALGRTGVIKHKIDTQGATPIKQQPRRMPFAKRSEVSSQIEMMLSRDVIEKSNSPWASPIVLVRKKDGSLRFCGR
ncbi:uncharacterized protein LOC125676529 [Ostrea edulis]|uniref:uncharacterized protein LOC125676529 n=1 Tax=Ostrea edulis TaxID=37623 RepID=UPI0024AFF3AC|nr:uncharacterized protein LOC125676529 [Ostrea edulis]